MPISPRAGTRYSSRIQPVPWLTMSSIRPLAQRQQLVHDAHVVLGYVDRRAARRARAGQPSISRVIACGLPTVSSKPSRRIVSTSTASCSSPLPCTSHASVASVVAQLNRDVADQLVAQSLLELAPGELAARASGERRGVDADRHRQRGLVHGEQRQCLRLVERGDRLADRHLRPSRRRRRSPRPRPPRPRRARGPRSRTAPRCARATRCRRAGTRRPPRRAGSSRGERGRRRAGRGRGRRPGSSPAPGAARRGRRSAPGSPPTSVENSGARSPPGEERSSVAHPSLAEA